MFYVSNGSSHKNGVKLEYEITSYINRCYQSNNDIFGIYYDLIKKHGPNIKITCNHSGGTKNKSDAVLLCTYRDNQNLPYVLDSYSISIKRKKYKNNKPCGTFDLINTSLSFFNNKFLIFSEDKVRKINDWLIDQEKCVKSSIDVNKIRPQFNDLCCELLDSVQDKGLFFLNFAYAELLKTDFLVIGKVIDKNDEETLDRIYIKKEKNFNLKDIFFKSDDEVILVKGRGKTSRTICIKKNGVIEKTPFRVRLILNNGLGAYYGLSNANKASVLTIKIQVDNVQYFINQMDEYIID